MTTTEPTPEFHGRLRATLAYALLAGVLLVVVGFPVFAAWRGQPIASDQLSTLDLFSGQILLAAFLAAWFLLQQRVSLRAFMALPKGDWSRRVWMGLRLGLIGWLLTLAAMAILARLGGDAGRAPAAGFVDFITWMATRPFGLRLALVLSAMTVEEVFFRAFLQPRLGLALATLCFALGHVGYGSPTMGAGVLVIGLVLAVEFERHRDLATCVIAHGLFDGIQLLLVLPLVARHLG
jgi:membrane protease YdiL (CAAX protease family)